MRVVSKLVQLFSSSRKNHYSVLFSPRTDNDVLLTREINRCARFKPSHVQGSEIHLIDYSAVHTDGYPVFACVVSDLDDESIYFYRIPKQYYEQLENQVLSYITHEIIHKVLLKIEGEKANEQFDEKFEENNGKSRRELLKWFLVEREEVAFL